MRITISGKNFNTYKKLEDTIEKKFEKLEKYFSDDIDVHVVLSQERGKQKIEVNINAKGARFRTEQVTSDVHEGIDRAISKLSSQMSRFKGKLQKRYKDNHSVRFESIPSPEVNTEPVGDIVKTKSLRLIPMSVDEAVLEMEMIEHDFFVFINSETDLTNIVYKRADGHYGVLETVY